MKRRNPSTSFAVWALVVAGGWSLTWGCGQSKTQAPAAGLGEHSDLGGAGNGSSVGGAGNSSSVGGAGNGSGGGAGGKSSNGTLSDASVTDSGQSHRDPLDADAPDANELPADSSTIGRDFPDVEMDALPPAPEAPVCSGMVTYFQSKVLLELGPKDTILGSVTPDGLTAAWMVPGSFSPGDSRPPSLLVADRTSIDAAFDSPQVVDLGAMAIAQSKVALSPDRLRLVVVRADLQGFLELRRADPSSAFSPPTEGDFTDINLSVNGTADAVGDPTIAPDDQTFVYTRAQSIQESRRTAGAYWPEGSAVSIKYPLTSGQTLSPSALSQDLLTLFVWDDKKQVEFAAWRVVPSDPFDMTAHVGAFPDAQPSPACDSLFFAATGDDGNVYLAQASSTYSP